MSVSTYAELKSAIASWLHRSDLTSVLADFVTLSESKFNRRLRTRFQETAFGPTTPTSYEIAIPSDFAAVRKLWRTSDRWELIQRPIDVLTFLQEGGQSTGFAITDAFVFDGTSEVGGIYYAKVTALSDSQTTNWLLTAYPDLYLWAGLAEAAFYSKDLNAAAMWTERTDALIKEINGTSQRDKFSGPLRVTAR
jgi:hypothetical protein